ncbi:MAG: dienelactone hydrolase family protein, partial [Candidatus Eremiobacteraeota bacterium]|nr:dienelactone hydrolase family protein [Candidatus Eremiobacteraeota bacterium]
PPGAAFVFDDAGRDRGQADAAKTPVATWDSDLRFLLDMLRARADVASDKLGALGTCTGGHIAFRAAFDPAIRATACFYPTGLEDGKLGLEADAGSLARASEIRGELLLVFGTLDPHVSAEGRAVIDAALRGAGVRYEKLLFDAEHAFMRDEGARYDPAATDAAIAAALLFFNLVF